MELINSSGYTIIQEWLSSKSLHPFRFQEETWQHISSAECKCANQLSGKLVI
jgi:hypothetical protein